MEHMCCAEILYHVEGATIQHASIIYIYIHIYRYIYIYMYIYIWDYSECLQSSAHKLEVAAPSSLSPQPQAIH